MRIAATSILNINLSAANMDTLVQAVDSWNKLRELEEKAFILMQVKENLYLSCKRAPDSYLVLLFLTTYKFPQEATSPDAPDKKSTHLALDEDDFQTVIVENNLGCDIYLKKNEHNFDPVSFLPHGDCISLRVPPPRYSDRLNVADISREPRCYVGIQIVEAKVIIHFFNLSIFITVSLKGTGYHKILF